MRKKCVVAYRYTTLNSRRDVSWNRINEYQISSYFLCEDEDANSGDSWLLAPTVFVRPNLERDFQREKF